MPRTFILLVVLSVLSRADDPTKVAVTCPARQAPHGGSCYEVLGVRHTFAGAQAWCERHGGHLAFIPDKEKQLFLQRHLDPNQDFWFGAASCGEGRLFWLDGSPVTFSVWARTPKVGPSCSHILGGSGFQWEATSDCAKKLPFVCQFDAGRSTMCGYQSATLRCGSGQVLVINGGFYGRKNNYYCQSRRSLLTAPPQDQCGWLDATKSLTAHCGGLQTYQVSGAWTAVETCPKLGSYLSLDYHCKGIILSARSAAAVHDDVTVSVRWLLQSSWGNFRCKLSTGDGRVIYLERPEASELSVVHRYLHPGTFAVAAQCINADKTITACRVIAIHQPVRGRPVGVLSFKARDYTALQGQRLQIQMGAKAGSEMTYRTQIDDLLVPGFCISRGIVPVNIKVVPGIVHRLGKDCHRLTVRASNMICVLEKVSRVKASVLADKGANISSETIAVGVSLKWGAPALLLFTVLQHDKTISKSTELNTKKAIFHLGHRFHGCVKRNLNAWKIFSSVAVEFDMLSTCSKDTDTTEKEKHVRIARSDHSVVIVATPDNSVSVKQNIKLLATSSDALDDPSKRYKWTCKPPCKCQDNSEGLTHVVRQDCLPHPFQFITYRFSVVNIADNNVDRSEFICITVTPTKPPGYAKVFCTQGCNPVTADMAATIKLDCNGAKCADVNWYITDLTERNSWPEETRSCYVNAGKRPLKKVQDGGTQYTVSGDTISEAMEKGLDISVIIIYDANKPLYKEYTINTGPTPPTVTYPMTPTVGAGSFSHPTTPPPTSLSPGSILTTSIKTDLLTRPTTPHPTSLLPGSHNSILTTSIGLDSLTHPTTPPPTSLLPGNSNGIPTTSVSPLQCTIAPLSGTIFDAFNITCNTAFTCIDCQYCFKTHKVHLQCSNNKEVITVFLPPGIKQSNYTIPIAATAKHGGFMASTVISVQVMDSLTDSSSSDEDLVKDVVAKLKKQGQLSGETAGQIFSAASNQSSTAERQKLRRLLLQVIKTAVQTVPITTPAGVQKAARALIDVAQTGSELRSSAVEEASVILANLSAFLLHVEVNGSKEMVTAAKTIVEGVSSILEYTYMRNVSDAIVVALKNTQRALLRYKTVNQEPVFIKEKYINMLVDRVTPDRLHRQSIKIPDCLCLAFSLPKLPSTLVPPGEPVDVQMLTLDKNPFAWNEKGNISGVVGELSLTAQDGSLITVENLSEDIEIRMPRPSGGPVTSSVLDLGNFSTMVIDLPSADSTVLLKMVPSVHPLPFKAFLGYKGYPTDTDFVAMTEMPLRGANLEEEYTWVLQPKDLKGCTGEHYLVIRPVVGAGVKSINASLTVSSITAACNFWNESNLDWSNYGCRVGVQTTHLVTQCLCNHLTFFGSSFFVTPNLVDPSRSAELFGTFAENPVVVCFVGALFLLYFLVLIWARRTDIQDVAKAKITVLQDNDPVDDYSYLLSVNTGHRRGASTSSQVTVTLLGADGSSEPHHLTDAQKQVFERGAVDVFLLTVPFPLGELQGIRLWHNHSGSHPAWFVGIVVVQDLQTGHKWHFLCNAWLAIDVGDCSLDRVFPVAKEADLKRFRNLFFMKAAKDFSDGHLWYSVISRPPSSTFTRVQRISCCFSLLLCTMLTSIMFYGIPSDPSEQTMDLGHFEFTWQQFMIGVQSSLIMFPINILIVSIFRHTRPRESGCCKCKRETPDTTGPMYLSQAGTQVLNDDVAFEAVMKEIKGITQLLSKTVKNNTLCTELGPKQQTDINAALSVVEGLIKQGNESEPQQPGQAAKDSHPFSEVSVTSEGFQKGSDQSRYLYQQLSRIEKALILLGPSSFHSPHSNRQALQQVRDMRSYLEDGTDQFSCVDLAGPPQDQGSLTDPHDGHGRWGKPNCCHGGFPWWFVFFGWLLVIATSVVAGYFTMIYGLKFGKERSISWLISMVVSFFQSVLVIQPLKVVFLAIFFALVIKKVDADDYQHMVVAKSKSNPGELKDPQTIRRGSGLYHPPAPADVEKMRKNKILEEKAFAFLREFFIHLGFMWMLLLLAYGQRDPNAYFLQKHIKESFSPNVSDSMSLGDVFSWASTDLLRNLFGKHSGFITDGNSKLVGNARIRQLRVQRSSCQVAGAVQHLVSGCNAPYSLEVEDTGSYGPGWNRSARNQTTSLPDPWKYQTQAELRAYPVWGKMLLYGGGGFVAELGPDLENASRSLQYLSRSKWLDGYTRAIFVEFTVYNANVNLFCIATLLLETAAVGAFQFFSDLQTVQLYQSTGGLHIFVMVAEITYMIFILYYMFVQVTLLKKLRWLYFTHKWNLFELAVIVLSWSAVAVFIKRTLTGNRDIAYYRNNRAQFASFYETALADSTLQYLIAFLVLLSTLKLWRLLRLNPKMNVFTATLQRAWSDITGFLLIIVIMFAAYSTVLFRTVMYVFYETFQSSVMYGWQLSSYRTVGRALLSVISLQIGIFNYEEVLSSHPLLGGCLFGSCVVFMTFVVLNLLVSGILAAFSKEQKDHKPSDDEEIFNLLVRRICSLLGIKTRAAEETQLPDVTMGPDHQ